VSNYASGIIDKQRSELVATALPELVATALREHKKCRWCGVAEATFGAFIWSILLIAISLIAARGGIDLLDVYQRVAGHH